MVLHPVHVLKLAFSGMCNRSSVVLQRGQMVLGRACSGICAAEGEVDGCRGFPAPVWLTGFVGC